MTDTREPITKAYTGVFGPVSGTCTRSTTA